MTLRRHALLALVASCLVAAPTLAGGRYQTENFSVDAPTPQLAKAFGEAAEKFRREKALQWLGQEMPRWRDRCPLSITVRPDSSGGDTEFTFGEDDNRRPVVLSQKMRVFGDVPRMLHSVLPHEVTHTVFAYHFGRPVPRWADEGGSVLSENDEERAEHDLKCRRYLSAGQAYRFTELFTMRDYPSDVHTLYAQGYSISQFLVDRGDRQKMLEFVAVGMQRGNRNWEAAAKVYGFDSVDDMQAEWLTTLKKTAPQRLAARNAAGAPRAQLTASSAPVTRTSPSAALMLEPPVTARGVAPAESVSSHAPIASPVKLLPPVMPR